MMPYALTNIRVDQHNTFVTTLLTRLSAAWVPRAPAARVTAERTSAGKQQDCKDNDPTPA